MLIFDLKLEETMEQISVLAESIRRYKKFRRNQMMFAEASSNQQLLPHPQQKSGGSKKPSVDHGG